MNFPPPTPPPAAFLTKGDKPLSFEQLYRDLGQIVSKIEPSAPPNKLDHYADLLHSLSEHFLSKFPQASRKPWSSHGETIKLTRRSVNVIQAVLQRVPALRKRKPTLLQPIASDFIHLMLILDAWIVSEREHENNAQEARQLRDYARSTFSATLAYLLTPPLSALAISTRDTTNHVLIELIAIVDELLLSTQATFPVYLSPFVPPRVRQATANDPFQDDGSIGQFPLRDYPQVCRCALSILSVVATAISSTVNPAPVLDLERACVRILSTCMTEMIPRLRWIDEGLDDAFFCVKVLAQRRNSVLSTFIKSMEQVLILRMDAKPPTEVPFLDSRLLECLQDCIGVLRPHTTGQVLRISSGLERGEWRTGGRNFLNCLAAYCEVSLSSELEAPYELLKGLFEQEGISFGPAIGGGSQSWRQIMASKLFAAVPATSFPQPTDLISDQDWVLQSINRILEHPDFPLRLIGARSLLSDVASKFSCFLAHCPVDSCKSTTSDSSLPVEWFQLVIGILSDSRDSRTALGWACVYRALDRGLRHHCTALPEKLINELLDYVFRGIAESERECRLAAGRCLATLLLRHCIVENVSAITSKIFGHIRVTISRGSDNIRETAMVLLGHLGRDTSTTVQEFVLCELVCQLGHESPVLKGLAHLQIKKIASFHGKSTYSLLSPHLSQIALIATSNILSKPQILQEVSHVLAISPQDFLSRTLHTTLPCFVVSGESHILESIAAHLTTTLSNLILQITQDVLSRLFLLPSRDATSRALDFLVRTLQAAAAPKDSDTIDGKALVTSCTVPLLSDLVISLGAEDTYDIQNASNALEKVYVVLRGHQLLSSKSSDGHFPSLIRPYILGVMAHISDALQEVHGHRNLAAKKQILRGLTQMVVRTGRSANAVSPQIMATIQSTIVLPELGDTAAETWYAFVTTLDTSDCAPYIASISASIAAAWGTLQEKGREACRRILNYVLIEHGREMGHHLAEVVNFSSVPALASVASTLEAARKNWSQRDRVKNLLNRILNDNGTVAVEALRELKVFLAEHHDWLQQLASGDSFHQDIANVVESLLRAATRESDHSEKIRLLAYQCLGCLGAVDPDRVDLASSEPEIIVLHNFDEESEAFSFALHLIRDLLVGSFHSTSDTKYQSHLAYAIQELLKICGFTSDLVKDTAAAVPIKVRNRWNSLSKQILQTISPLLESQYRLQLLAIPKILHPVYVHQATYREWVQNWALFLNLRASGDRAKKIFDVFRSAVRNKDAGVARHLLPHLVLNVLMGPSSEDVKLIQEEITSVLLDQVEPSPDSNHDKRHLSAQLIFSLLDHLSRWMRLARQELQRRDVHKRPSQTANLEQRITRVNSLLRSIDEELVAKAAFESKAFARSLMTFENQIRAKKSRNFQDGDLQAYYDRLHQIYAQLDEPDGMEGIASKVLEPSLEHQIRHHESLGHWTSAQSCWEVRLQQSPNELTHHLGLLRCLRSLGHYDTLLTHISGILSRNPNWEPRLLDFHIQGAMMVGDWSRVEQIASTTETSSPQLAIARCLLAVRCRDQGAITRCLVAGYTSLGSSITTSGHLGYRRAYGAVLNIHLLQEFQMIAEHNFNDSTVGQPDLSASLSRKLKERLASISPSFSTRELILSARRVAFSIVKDRALDSEISQTWLDMAKIARKAGHAQTAYGAVLQAQQRNAPFYFVEQSKLVKENGESLRALHELENSLQGEPGEVSLDRRMGAKALLLRAKWMRDAERYPANDVLRAFKDVLRDAGNWENAHFHLGSYYDQRAVPGKFNGDTVHVVHCYRQALQLGSKFVFQTVPRLLTLWLDFGMTKVALKAESSRQIDSQESNAWLKVKEEINEAINLIAVWKWFIAFPQIVSRVGHENTNVVEQLSILIARILSEYPRQALWMFMSVVKSQKPERSLRGKKIIHKLKANPANIVAASLAEQCVSMATAFLELCDYPIVNDSDTLSVTKNFPHLRRMVPTDLIVPLQESLVACLPPASGDDVTHRPFPQTTPTIQDFSDEIEIMKSLIKPRKLTIKGSDGQSYMFLGKPKDDLRKDARVMDLNSIINKLLKKNSESRKRRLRIRTYGIVTLNEECGFIQWVPNTVPLKPVLSKCYGQRDIPIWTKDLNALTLRLVPASDKEAAEAFVGQILPSFPPVFHEWFLETFPEPTTWLASRLAYARTASVMSMVGFILGLGDRHCENILLDTNTGDVVHVDLNCLFERGKQLVVPERMPFRLTHNLVDGLGVTGVEGVFRIGCEITMGLLRENRNSLMSVLDAFIHDPLVEWEDEKRKNERKRARDEDARRKGSRKNKGNHGPAVENDNDVRENTDAAAVAQGALEPIKKKLCGMSSTIKIVPARGGGYISISPEGPDSADKELSVGAMVEALIREATDNVNLGKAYGGWMAWL